MAGIIKEYQNMNKHFDNFLSDGIMESAEVFPIISLDERSSEVEVSEGQVLPILPLRNMVIFPGVLMGKVLLLSVIPNLLLVYLFYTLDSFKLAVGMITGAMSYLIPSFFML